MTKVVSWSSNFPWWTSIFTLKFFYILEPLLFCFTRVNHSVLVSCYLFGYSFCPSVCRWNYALRLKVLLFMDTDKTFLLFLCSLFSWHHVYDYFLLDLLIEGIMKLTIRSPRVAFAMGIKLLIVQHLFSCMGIANDFFCGIG